MDRSNEPQRELFETVRLAGQQGVLRFWESLDGPSRNRLVSELEEVNFEEVASLFGKFAPEGAFATQDQSALKPVRYTALPAAGGDRSAWSRAAKVGEAAIRSGKVASLTVAGGQGTRLGFDGPKGMFPITPVKGKSLFEVLAAKIRASSAEFECHLPWYVMTSVENHAATVAYFADNQYFGLDPADIRFFRQGRLPAVDFEGRILLSSRNSIAMSPDGHGGSLRALARSGALEEMKREGVESISYFHVDNPLVRPVDPTFIGFHVLGGSEMSSKTALKAYSHEKIGTFCRDGNGIRVIEYSDLPESLGEARGKDGRLKFHAGSVGIHILNRNFVERITSGKSDTYALPFHRAEKIVDTIDDAGRPVIPKTANAIKFEMFLFDAIPFARNPVIVETDRRDEFSPVKNSVGIDSAESCRADLLRMWTRWLCAAGEHIRCDDTGLPEAVFEVDPLFADDAETFVKKWRSLRSRPEIRDGTVVE